jgi:hypothetical protein
MHFQLRYITRDFEFGDAQISVADPTRKINILLRKRTAEENPPPPPLEARDGIVTVTYEKEMTEAVQSEAVSSGQLSMKKEGIREVLDKMTDLNLRVLRLVRWRTNARGRPNPIRNALRDGFRWSTDGVQWKPVADCMSAKLTLGPQSPKWTPEIAEFVIAEACRELDEPLAHEMLREASANSSEYARSSLVLAVAAAEVGFKQFASKTFSDNGWFQSKRSQSKPLIQMITEFPWSKVNLRINGKVPTIPESILAGIKDGIRVRNLVVHAGIAKLEGETVESALTAVRELLYFLDALCICQNWPFNYIGPEARKEFV